MFVRVGVAALVTDKGSSLSSAWGDYDNDGDLDVVVSNAFLNAPNRFYRNNGDGTFNRLDEPPFSADLARTWGITSGDYDNDGDLDLYMANGPGAPNFLYRNDAADGNNWLKLKLEGSPSNRAAIGAKVQVAAVIGGQPTLQWREVSTQNTFLGQHSLTVHIGLGKAARVDSVHITWPSGTIDVLRDVAPNQELEVIEGEVTSSIPRKEEDLPDAGAARLDQNYPNPMQEETVINMLVVFFEYQTTFDDDTMHNRLISYDADGQPTAYEEMWAFVSDNAFRWTLYQPTSGGRQKVMGGLYERK